MTAVVMSAAAAVCAALALLAWPSSTVVRRVQALSGEPGRGSRRLRGPALAVVAVPVIGALAGTGAGIAAGIVVATGISRRRRARERAEGEGRDAELCRALSVIAAEMSVGAPMVGACRAAADELGDESGLARELRRIAARVELGGHLGSESVPPGYPGLRRLSDAWSISVRHGLPMVALIESLRRDLVQRRDFIARTEAGLAGPRATALVLAGLPALGLGLGQLMGAGPIAVLLGTSLGSVLLVVGVALAAVGVRWADAIVARVTR
ncbi:type II secretion system F family protein [Gordonia caeni]|uniref:Type II secretion system F family protein n=1 Tax=Gordonia caeni TaxID=1007097 RepID=A0ABP7PV21_9ACTN